MNWSSFHIFFLFPQQPVQNSQPIHSTTLQTFCQVNFFWTTPSANCRSPDPFHSFPCPLFSQLSLSCDSFIIISHFFCCVKQRIVKNTSLILFILHIRIPHTAKQALATHRQSLFQAIHILVLTCPVSPQSASNTLHKLLHVVLSGLCQTPFLHTRKPTLLSANHISQTELMFLR